MAKPASCVYVGFNSDRDRSVSLAAGRRKRFFFESKRNLPPFFFVTSCTILFFLFPLATKSSLWFSPKTCDDGVCACVSGWNYLLVSIKKLSIHADIRQKSIRNDRLPTRDPNVFYDSASRGGFPISISSVPFCPFSVFLYVMVSHWFIRRMQLLSATIESWVIELKHCVVFFSFFSFFFFCFL